MSRPQGEIDADPTGLSTRNDTSLPKVGLSKADFRLRGVSSMSILLSPAHSREHQLTLQGFVAHARPSTWAA